MLISDEIINILKSNNILIYCDRLIPYGRLIKVRDLTITIYDHKYKYFFQGHNNQVKNLINNTMYNKKEEN